VRTLGDDFIPKNKKPKLGLWARIFGARIKITPSSPYEKQPIKTAFKYRDDFCYMERDKISYVSNVEKSDNTEPEEFEYTFSFIINGVEKRLWFKTMDEARELKYSAFVHKPANFEVDVAQLSKQ
jgi:hypothetical protein